MNRFADVLERAADRLQIPEAPRRRVLLEIAADLEDSYRHFREQGLSEEEATLRAKEAFGASDEALHLLSRIHEQETGGLTERITHQIGTLWAKILLIAILAFEILLAWRILFDRSFFVHPSPFLWPVAALALAVFAFTIWKLKQIYSRSEFDLERLRAGLGVPLVFAGASLGISMLGFLFHLQRFFRLNASGAPEDLFRNFAGWMISISSLMTVALLTSIVGGLVWLVLSRLVARTEAREVEGLLQPTH